MILEITLFCASLEEADRISSTLLEARLIAQASRGMAQAALFRRDGRIVQEEEFPLTLLTRPALAREVEAVVRSLHSYAIPALQHWQVEANPDHEAWVRSETRDPA
ncbi:divalent cation tolerance protein CutA [Pseudooceanicola sp. CBS1P-1]|uniref:Divalent cation tolerance protein CutA n=1 Tax=Pseudooceanicola albus TaxID=2692189 RepID=A0A6L7GDN3_9RHOB|nr:MULTISPECIES: divalent cation tolerance protein CutA [Pseudooceanicola]MBT9384280.1 divalent cation tolerance protein CutA [Pseudooceanicola endophyticus]MXN20873.1 divalent cation tolerance protein CutA [Pseudooceanicola albus]